MIVSVNLLDSEIYKIQEVWTGQKDLRCANDALKSLPKGLQFFHTMCPSELPKVMGLKRIINLMHFALCQIYLLHLVWKRREKWRDCTSSFEDSPLQVGTSLQKMSPLPLITSETIWHHSWGCMQPRESDAKEEDGRPNDMSTSD